VLYLPFGEGEGNTVSDLSGYENHGTISGAVWKQLPSGIWILSYDGEDDYVDCGDDASLDVSVISMEVWVRFFSFPTDTHVMIIHRMGIRYPAIGYDKDSKKIFIRFYDGVSWYSAVSTFIPTAEKWYHIVGIYDPNPTTDNLRLYIDGGLEDSVTRPDYTLPTKYYTLRIGWDGARRPPDGLTSEVCIYNQALSADKIAKDFEEERGLYGV